MLERFFKVLIGAKSEPKFFCSKAIAKKQRVKEHEHERRDVCIMRGPDHWRGESFGV